MIKLYIGPVTKVQTTTIIPVEQLTIHSEINLKTSWWYGSKELHALVISSPSGVHVYDKRAHELNIDELIRAVPELTEHL
jgi:hypothetical protein